MSETVTRELLREGEWTRDGRMLRPGTTTWRDEVPLMIRPQAVNGIDGSHLVGVVSNIRREGNRIVGDLSVEIDGSLIVTCEVDQVEEHVEHDQGVEFIGARIVAAMVNEPKNYPWP